MPLETFQALVAMVTSRVQGRRVLPALADELNGEFAAGGEWFRKVEAACHDGIREGWMCAREAGAYGTAASLPPDRQRMATRSTWST